jgi:hypothetical protein
MRSGTPPLDRWMASISATLHGERYSSQIEAAESRSSPLSTKLAPTPAPA